MKVVADRTAEGVAEMLRPTQRRSAIVNSQPEWPMPRGTLELANALRTLAGRRVKVVKGTVPEVESPSRNLYETKSLARGSSGERCA
jgi:hypothetical protein